MSSVDKTKKKDIQNKLYQLIISPISQLKNTHNTAFPEVAGYTYSQSEN